MTEKEINNLFSSLIEDFGDKRGFSLLMNGKTKTDPPYLERFNGEDIEVIGSFYLDVFNNRIYMTEVFSKHFYDVESIWWRYFKKIKSVSDNFRKKSLVTIASNVSVLRDYDFETSKKKWFRYRDSYEEEMSEEGAFLLFENLTQNIDNYVIPTFEKYKDIESLDKAMNATPGTYFECIHLFTGNGLFFKKMIVSKLASNKNYEMICHLMKQKINLSDDLEPSKKVFLDVWEELKSELDSM